MNLLDIRKQFVKLSGRYDLVVDTTNFVDNGADFYINAGQNMLDRLSIIKENEIPLYLDLKQGEFSLVFPNRCLSILEVWVNNGEERTQLTKSDLRGLKATYSDLVSEIDQGPPLYYVPASIRMAEAADQNTLGEFLNISERLSDYDGRGIIIAPPVDEDYTVEIFGRFFQNELDDDEAESYWTLFAPEMLIKAALYQVYSLSGRSSDAKRIMETLTFETISLDMLGVEEDISELDTMGD